MTGPLDVLASAVSCLSAEWGGEVENESALAAVRGVVDAVLWADDNPMAVSGGPQRVAAAVAAYREWRPAMDDPGAATTPQEDSYVHQD